MKRFLLLITDIATLYAALFISLVIRYGQEAELQLDVHIIPFSFIFILWILSFYITNLYDISAVRNGVQFYSNQIRAILISSVLSISFFYLIPFFGITPKRNLFIFIIVFSFLNIVIRIFLNDILGKGYKKPLVIVGINPQVSELALFIKENPQLGYEIKYIVDINKNPSLLPQMPVNHFGIIQGVNGIEEVIRRERINTVVISPEAYQEPNIINLFYHSIGNKVTFRNLSSFYEMLTNRVPLGAINQIWFLENLSEGSKNSYEAVKRIFDVIFSLIIGILVLPFFPIIALVIKLDSIGPVFYRQKRLGQAGKIFEIIKFRTMKNDAEKETGAVWAAKNDARATKVGRLLRKSRIDELPQLWNIIKGEMSFVGPRAERPEFYEQLRSGVPFYEERYLIKPGLTGWAQIHFTYASSVEDAAQKLQYDLYYIKNRSILVDLEVVLKTINISLRHAGR